MISLKSQVQWPTHEKTVPELHKSAVEKHRRVVQDLQQLAGVVNTAIPGGTSGVLPILHPDDPTSGIFGGTNPISIQFRIGGVTIITIDANGMRMGA